MIDLIVLLSSIAVAPISIVVLLVYLTDGANWS
jgi:hypothetical protein